MNSPILIVPGLNGSGPGHWQSWMEQEIPGAIRVKQKAWDQPILARWAETVLHYVDNSPQPVWIIAHSFGCLASVVACADRPGKVAGMLLVAPADPERFAPLGLREIQITHHPHYEIESIASYLPQAPLPCPSLVVASSNDPWVKLKVAVYWSHIWNSRFLNLGNAGHINIDSGHGAWPQGLALFHDLQNSCDDTLHGSFGDAAGNTPRSPRGRQGVLAKIRQRTRSDLRLDHNF